MKRVLELTRVEWETILLCADLGFDHLNLERRREALESLDRLERTVNEAFDAS